MTIKMLRNSLMVVLLALLGAMQATAVEYKNQYRRVRSTEYRVQTVNNQSSVVSVQTTAPTVGFQSTSAYSGQWNQDAQQSTLNSDGSVNSDAYLSSLPGSSIRRGGNPGTPTDEDEDEGEQQPIGDTPWWLFVFLLAAYGVVVRRKHA